LLQTLNSLPTLLRTLFVEVFLPTFQWRSIYQI
jgi:hypothetical protein